MQRVWDRIKTAYVGDTNHYDGVPQSDVSVKKAQWRQVKVHRFAVTQFAASVSTWQQKWQVDLCRAIDPENESKQQCLTNVYFALRSMHAHDNCILDLQRVYPEIEHQLRLLNDPVHIWGLGHLTAGLVETLGLWFRYRRKNQVERVKNHAYEPTRVRLVWVDTSVVGRDAVWSCFHRHRYRLTLTDLAEAFSDQAVVYSNYPLEPTHTFFGFA